MQPHRSASIAVDSYCTLIIQCLKKRSNSPHTCYLDLLCTFSPVLLPSLCLAFLTGYSPSIWSFANEMHTWTEFRRLIWPVKDVPQYQHTSSLIISVFRIIVLKLEDCEDNPHKYWRHHSQKKNRKKEDTSQLKIQCLLQTVRHKQLEICWFTTGKKRETWFL